MMPRTKDTASPSVGETKTTKSENLTRHLTGDELLQSSIILVSLRHYCSYYSYFPFLFEL